MSFQGCTPKTTSQLHWSETKMRDVICKSISQACKGRTAWNKGKPNPEQSKRMKENNPNKAGMYNKNKFKKGHTPWNKKPTVKKPCYVCGTEFTVTKNKKLTCGKSCAATYSNHKRAGTLNNLTTTTSRTS